IPTRVLVYLIPDTLYRLCSWLIDAHRDICEQLDRYRVQVSLAVFYYGLELILHRQHHVARFAPGIGAVPGEHGVIALVEQVIDSKSGRQIFVEAIARHRIYQPVPRDRMPHLAWRSRSTDIPPGLALPTCTATQGQAIQVALEIVGGIDVELVLRR